MSLLSHAFLLLAATIVTSATQASADPMPAPMPIAETTIVLVHGAFADGSSWSKVIPLLQARGYKVVAV